MITGIVSGIVAGVISSLILVNILKRRAEKCPKRQMEVLRFLTDGPKGQGEIRSHLIQELDLTEMRADQTIQELLNLKEIEPVTVPIDTSSSKICLRKTKYGSNTLEKGRRRSD